MSEDNGAVKEPVEAEVVEAAKTIDGAVPEPGQTVEPMKTIVGKVVIEVTENGLNVQAPPNLLLALAVLNAGKAFLEMQYTDALKAAMRQAPKIVRPSDSSIGNMMKNLNGRPS